MSNRNYNVFFNTHTVSGIVISIALYVIFFAGAFALFKGEIQIWEEGKTLSYTERKSIDYDKLLNHLDRQHELTGRDIQINLNEHSDHIYSYLLPSKDSLASEKGKTSQYLYTDINNGTSKNYNEQYSLGEFLFRLHFFHQLPSIGVYLAGFVSLFFLFAIVTGVIVHWKKIIPNFYAFNPKVILKRVWTDAHTALGVVGLPFQFIFAVTGAYFAISILVLVPANFLYNGDQAKLLEDLRPERKAYQWESRSEQALPSFNEFAQKAAQQWEHFHLTDAYIKNYGGTNMKYVLLGEMHSDHRFVGIGRISYDARTGTVEEVKNPTEADFKEDFQKVVSRLHFADYGGIPMKIIYFIMALITCFVIITGVLIWVEARNKKSMSLRQRLYTAKVGHIYLAMCLSLLPVTALAFLFVKLSTGSFLDKQSAIYYFFFGTWLVFTLFFRFKRNNFFTNKWSLLLGAIFGFLVPIANGIVSGNWLWITFSQGQFDILLVDVLWLIIASTSLVVYFKIKPEVQEQSAFTKTPIDYNNIKTLLKEEDEARKKATASEILTDINYIPMRTKISLLWIFIAIGFIFHHVYGLATVYFKESVLMEGATGETPMWAHQWRIAMEGLALTFGLLSLEVQKKWFITTSLVWAIILGIFNLYHVITAVIYEASNLSEILVLLLLVIANAFLIKNITTWRKEQ